MKKDFDNWNKQKKLLDEDRRFVQFHEREVWWCSIGVNVGSEQHSQSHDFSRPILVVRRFTQDMFWGIPLTTKLKIATEDDDYFRVRVILEGLENDVLILQMRSYDRKRLIRKITTMDEVGFAKITDYIKQLI